MPTVSFRTQRLFWDGILAVLVLSMVAGSIAPLPWPVRAACLLALLCILYGTFVEPQLITTRRVRVRLPGHAGLRIALVSDLHVGPLQRSGFVERVVRRVMLLQPDIILLAGDFVADHESDTAALTPLSGLSAPLGVYAVLGNHDTGEYVTLFTRKRYTLEDSSKRVAAVLRKSGITLLQNEHRDIPTPQGLLTVAGIHDLWSMPDAERIAFLHTLDADILLSHQPDVILDPLATNASLIVSGHTHGGQIRLPFIGSIPPIPQNLPRRYDHGVFSLAEECTLFISHGMGVTSLRSRFLAWPEVVMLTTEH